MRRTPLGFLTLLCLGAAPLAPQGAGDLIALDVLGERVLTVPRSGGAVTTLQPLRTDLSYGPMMAGPGDNTAYLIATYLGGINRHFLEHVTRAGVSTLATFMIVPELTVDMGLDEAGDLLLLTRYNYARNGLYVAPFGASTLTRVAAWPSGVAEAVAFTEDLDTGDWWVLDEAGYIHRLARTGGAVVSIVRVSPAPLTSGDLVMDPRLGQLVIAAHREVVRFDPVRRTVTTLYRFPVRQGGSEAMGLHFDQDSRGFFAAGWVTAGPANLGTLVQLDPQGAAVRTLSTGAGARLENVFAAWGRAFTPLTAPAVGRAYKVALRSRRDAGRAYLAALAFGTRPGIPTPLGPIPLNPDPLFFLSRSGAPLFRGFTGRLDALGGARLEILVPGVPALRGLRLMLAAVTYDAIGLRGIRGPHPFTLR